MFRYHRKRKADIAKHISFVYCKRNAPYYNTRTNFLQFGIFATTLGTLQPTYASMPTCEHFESISPADMGLGGFEDTLRTTKNAVHFKHPIASSSNNAKILGCLDEKVLCLDNNNEQRYILRRHMCELFENEANENLAFLYYKIINNDDDHEDFVPLILRQSIPDDNATLQYAQYPSVGEVYHVAVPQEGADNINLDSAELVSVDSPYNLLVGMPWPRPVYQTVANLVGKPHEPMTFELDKTGGATITGETLFGKIERLINTQQIINEDIVAFGSQIDELPQTLAETSTNAMSEVMSSYKTEMITRMINEIETQTTSYMNAVTHQASEIVQDVLKQQLSDTDSLVQKINDAVSSLDNGADLKVQILKDWVEERIKDINIPDIVYNILNEIRQKANEYVAGMVHLLGESTNSLVNTIQTNVNTNNEIVTGKFTELNRKIDEFQNQTNQDFLYNFSEFAEDLDAVKNWLTELITLSGKIELSLTDFSSKRTEELESFQARIDEFGGELNKIFAKHSNQYIATIKHIVSDELQFMRGNITESLRFFQQNMRNSLQVCLEQVPLIIREVLLNNEMLLALSNKIQDVGDQVFKCNSSLTTSLNNFEVRVLDVLEKQKPPTILFENVVTNALEAQAGTLATQTGMLETQATETLNIKRKLKQTKDVLATQVSDLQTQVLHDIDQNSTKLSTIQQALKEQAGLIEQKTDQITACIARQTNLIVHGMAYRGEGTRATSVADEIGKLQEPAHKGIEEASIASIANAQNALADELATVSEQLANGFSDTQAAVSGGFYETQAAVSGGFYDVQTAILDGVSDAQTMVEEKISETKTLMKNVIAAQSSLEDELSNTTTTLTSQVNTLKTLVDELNSEKEQTQTIITTQATLLNDITKLTGALSKTQADLSGELTSAKNALFKKIMVEHSLVFNKVADVYADVTDLAANQSLAETTILAGQKNIQEMLTKRCDTIQSTLALNYTGLRTAQSATDEKLAEAQADVETEILKAQDATKAAILEAKTEVLRAQDAAKAAMLGAQKAAKNKVLTALATASTELSGNQDAAKAELLDVLSSSETEFLDALSYASTELLGNQDAAKAELLDALLSSKTELLSAQDAAKSELLDTISYASAELLSAQDAAKVELLDVMSTSETEFLDALSYASTELLGNQDAAKAELLDALLASKTEVLKAQDAAKSELLDTISYASAELLSAQDAAKSELLDTISYASAELLSAQDAAKSELLDTISYTSAELLSAQDAAKSELLDTISYASAELLDTISYASAELLDTMSSSKIELLESLQNSEKSLQNTIASTIGIFPVEGKIQRSLLSKISEVLRETTKSFGYDPSFMKTMDSLSQILTDVGSLPQCYLGTVEILLNGSSRFAKNAIMHPSLSRYALSLLDFAQRPILCDYKIPLECLAHNIAVICRFVETIDSLTANSLVPQLVKIFGPKIPIFDTIGIEVETYAANAHFSRNDIGLYGWVKDLFAILYEIATVGEQGITPENLDGINKLKSNLTEMLIGREQGIYVLPDEFYGGMHSYVEILQNCANTINSVLAASPVHRIERKVDALIEAFREYKEKQERTTKVMYDALRFLVYNFWSIDISKNPECVRFCEKTNHCQ